ncbi:MAG: 50S ribosomal protein L3 [Candidatus Sungbacteria bacterium RIFCSPLOWO2_01_FULL_59_16]|uniref:Large ribosomal subunit protein uL3 n=1 Tax=Candidatus Sungbacteria bacterium RIFCSPLOWO2_01_FULL_59_16 TaxID=1802280 RepID=A0A1G2LBP6_9BACT|nr:MAG: 50S ribosomal protein L3 [Candidatus Sungbacteria bacterium RIFCSPLOWO2_01_FULL_59_16]
MKYLLGKKLGMAQVFNADGTAVPVTVIQTGSLTVIRAKTNERDGYEALQLGFGSRKQKNVARPQREEWKELGAFAVVREVRPPAGQARLPDGQAGGIPGQERGGQLDLTQFQEGDIVKVSGVSKGKGFQGVVKRHGFHGAPATHGTKHAHREPGSIGSTWPQRVVKGRRMAGRMGGERVTVRNLKVAKIDPERQLIAVKGAVPGRRGTLLEIRG